MLRRARIALVFLALASLFASPALFADDNGGNPEPVVQGGENNGNGDILEWLLGILGGDNTPDDDEFNPQHLPGG